MARHAPRSTLLLAAALWLVGTAAAAAPAPPRPPEAAPAEEAPAQPEGAEPQPDDDGGEEQPVTIDDDDAPTTDAPQAEPAAGPQVDPAEVERLQGEARDLRDQLFKARARVSVLASKLFRSRITLALRSNIERFYEVADLTITLDGAPVYHRDTGLPGAAGSLFEAFAAPGSHELGVSADLVARRDRTYKIRIHQAFTLVVPENSTVQSRLIIRETGTIWRFTKRRRGQYHMRTRLRAKAKSNDRGRGKRGAAKPAPAVGGNVSVGASGKAGGSAKGTEKKRK